jgi:hypothetical protein
MNDAQSTAVNTQTHEGNLEIQTNLISMFVQRIVNCRSVAQLVTHVPAIAQDRTKEGLNEIVSAHVKLASATHLLAEWNDVLAKESFGSIVELKSLRAPSIQLSKLAEKDGSIKKDFEESLKEAKRLALARMIFIKKREVEILRGLCEAKKNAEEVHNTWRALALEKDVSAEASALLLNAPCALSLVQSAISIGENTAAKQIRDKLKKSATVKTTKKDATAVMPTDKKGLEAFVKAIADRNKQSAMDKAKAKKSGKGQRGAGPSKTKNQKKSDNKVVKKDRKKRKGKRGTSSKKQPTKH